MTTTTVTVKYVNDPKAPGGRSGSIKDADGVYYSVPVAMLPEFQPNMTYEIDWKQNGNFKNVSAVRPVAVAAAGTGPGVAYSGGGTRTRTDPRDSANMWACAVMCSLIEAGQITFDMLYEAELEIRQKHRDVLLTLANTTPQPMTPPPPPPPKPKPTHSDEMNDEIPF
jgi:hypothetical protein